MNSPITGEKMELVREQAKLSFRKEDFDVIYHYWLCRETKEQFTSDELDRINQTQVHNKYREKYGIPFPEEIKEIKEKYGISASKMSEILGFGTNSYRLYENGEIPSVANGRLILAVKNPENFVKQVEASSHMLSEREVKLLLQKANELIERQRVNVWDMILTKHIFDTDIPNEFNGYRTPNFDKISNVIAFFGEKMDLFKTKLNKLLFYSDFAYFRKTGYSITGLTYKAIPYGTVPEHYDKLFVKLVDDEKIEIKNSEIGDYYCEIFKGVDNFDDSLFTNSEIDTLNLVANRFKSLSTTAVVKLNHDEKAWLDNKDDMDKISYQEYAFDLKTI